MPKYKCATLNFFSFQLKSQAEKEVKQLRNEVSQKKIDVALSKRSPYYRRSLGDIPNGF